MSRSGYVDDYEYGMLWSRAVQNAINGRRGQAFLREMLTALDAMPAKRLITDELAYGGNVCALGSVGVARGVDMSQLSVEDYDTLAETFGIASAMVREIEYENDEAGHWSETPEERYVRVRAWVASQLQTGES